MVGAFLKKAPNAKQFCISAHTRNTFNRTKISAEFMTRHRKRANELLKLQKQRNDYEAEVKDKMRRKLAKVGETTTEEIMKALQQAEVEQLRVLDLPHGDTLDGVMFEEEGNTPAPRVSAESGCSPRMTCNGQTRMSSELERLPQYGPTQLEVSVAHLAIGGPHLIT